MSKKIWVKCKNPKQIKIDPSTGVQFAGNAPISTPETRFIKEQLHIGWLESTNPPKSSKKAPIQDKVINMDEVVFEKGSLDECKVAELNEIAKHMEIEVSGNKADIIQLILDAHESVKEQ